MDKTATVDEILDWLSARRSSSNIAGMARYGINTDRAFGVSNTDLRALARQIGRNHARALALWQTGWREARLLASYTDEKKRVTLEQARSWAGDFDSWEIVDGVSDLFVDAGLGEVLISEFAGDEREFVRRTAFAMMVWTAVHQKGKADGSVIALLPLIEAHASDPRNFVKKAVNWALRSIGKRSLACHAPALELARKLAASDNATARWIGKDAVKELSDPKRIAMIGRKKTAASKAAILAAMR
jgi:3-methyladenine DNA glycosylase AlkD